MRLILNKYHRDTLVHVLSELLQYELLPLDCLKNQQIVITLQPVNGIHET